MKHIKLFEQFITEGKSGQQLEALRKTRELTKVLKERQAELAAAEDKDKEYAMDRVDTVQRLLVNAQNYLELSNAAASAEYGYDNPGVIKLNIKHKLEWIKDRQEVAANIKAKLKSNQSDDTRMFASNLVGSASALKRNLETVENAIENATERVEALKQDLAQAKAKGVK
jgi:hypothetical protein